MDCEVAVGISSGRDAEFGEDGLDFLFDRHGVLASVDGASDEWQTARGFPPGDI